MPADIGIDLGTASVLVYVRGRGVVLREPSVVAVEKETGKVMGIGEDAQEMTGRTPDHIVPVRPLQHGVISDYAAAERMIQYFIRKAVGRRTVRKPLITVSVPCSVTRVERRTVEDAMTAAGARDVILVEEPVAAAIGAGIDVTKPYGNIIVDIGGGTTDVAVVAMGGTVVSASVKAAGDAFDQEILRCMRVKHNLLIGERTAEELKIGIGCCYPLAENLSMEVNGRNLITGLPKTQIVTSSEILEALKEPAQEIVETVIRVLDRTPPELASDIADRGIVLTGGGAGLRGMTALLQKHTGINTMAAANPAECVVIGTGKYAQLQERMRKAYDQK